MMSGVAAAAVGAVADAYGSKLVALELSGCVSISEADPPAARLPAQRCILYGPSSIYLPVEVEDIEPRFGGGVVEGNLV